MNIHWIVLRTILTNWPIDFSRAFKFWQYIFSCNGYPDRFESVRILISHCGASRAGRFSVAAFLAFPKH